MSLLLAFSFICLHIGLICPGYPGHLNPTATLGAELKRRGHSVTLISSPPGKVTAEQHSLDFIPIGLPEYHSGALRVDLEHEGRLRGLKAFWHTIQLFKREEQFILRDLPSVLQQSKMDAICVDQLLPAAMDVADVHGIPFGVLCNALPLHLDPMVPPFVTTWRAPPNTKSKTSIMRRFRNRLANAAIVVAAAPMVMLVNRYRSKNGLPKHKRRTFQSSGNIQCTQLPSFCDFPRTTLPSHFFYSRPWHQQDRDTDIEFPYEKLDGRPIVYASLGTVQNRLQPIYLALADACKGLDVQLVMALGRKGANLLQNGDDAHDSSIIPSNAIVVDYAPQTKLLPRAAVVVTHAGMNTALESLACGRPIVAVPLCNDQPGIAARLEHLKVAEVIPAGRASKNSAILRKAIQRVLKDPSYATAAKQLQQKMRNECPTIEQTAELIEVGLRRSTPLLQDDPEVQVILSSSRSAPRLQDDPEVQRILSSATASIVETTSSAFTDQLLARANANATVSPKRYDMI